ncbi:MULTISPECIES: response regulator transcription factor [Bacillaceae]|jgi:two-component system NarL family response regulator/two-component system response regulator DesR|uniref:Two component transcriptional regulator, LuxR family n=1 Tax=Heyndrickxia coagulans 36D1 TaxID=345219 RepID=G2TIJ4_HEYCO|nr:MULTISPECIES: response regulator transcription factor [Heyndrickxia]NWN93532.1 response regulator transcription factor [Bacillus sp. (in: firmicutes)]AEP00531.1 two component transcriptional regulator, LuxR family [Heyndrickxia coagulans 36D1]KGT39510.1 transcriptional regulatory protein DesR [Heyndrickxia coagulans P38]MCI1576231.1 response regulator transcription factor [Heyndrickxia coagulans]MED4320568.1 response regulator transcription factor [Weizmannia sp. CD-2023]
MIRIFIAEDQRMLLSALGSLLGMEEDMEVIGQAVNGREALEAILKLKPDVCLMDIEMPVLSGLDVAGELAKKNALTKVIILTTFARPGYFERAVKSGVHGYLLKDGEIRELADAIRKCVAGKRVFSPELMFDAIREENPLTEREQQILRLAALGKTTKAITEELYLSSGTVRNYISDIIHKLGANNRTEAASIAEEKGWI